MIQLNPAVEAELEDLQRLSFSYFEHEVNPLNGLVADETALIAGGSPQAMDPGQKQSR